MGKRRRLNKLISKWIKSDLPEDRSTVLLLGVTRLSPASSPLRTRRPFSLPLALGVVSNCSKTSQVRRNSSISSNNSRRRSSVIRRNSCNRGASNNGECRPQQTTHQVIPVVVVDEVEREDKTRESETASTPPPPSRCPSAVVENVKIRAPVNCPSSVRNSLGTAVNCSTVPAMDASVDSIGACSLDMEASVDMSDWSEVSSDGTLRSANIVAPPIDQNHHHLPSYLSLACTVNGYSTTTNYDPIRLARSRDASPHRIESEHLTPNQPTYRIKHNLLSPPNLVPLPNQNGNRMAENILGQHHHEEFYRSTKTTFLSQESHFSSNIFTKDSVDACTDKSQVIQSKCVTFESKTISNVNNQNKNTFESTIKKEYTNGTETKSFIQQRVERLYGPGALAQCFVSPNRLKHRSAESENHTTNVEHDRHSKSFTDKLLEDVNPETSMKQSSSSPSLPVLRHLRPEFRAQLPIISPRKSTDACMQKSVTVPKLKDDEVKVNGHSKFSVESNGTDITITKSNGCDTQPLFKEQLGDIKNGHYFLKILEEQTSRLLGLADKVESELGNKELSEEVVGKLRSASGKARLLVSQKMQQFRGLCTNNINQSPGEAFPITNEDLQGFWDMVMLQVDQVDKIFEEIEKLKENNWEEISIEKETTNINGSSKPRKTVAKPKVSSAVTEETRKQREEQRKRMIEERRKAMKARQTSKPSIEIFVPESS